MTKKVITERQEEVARYAKAMGHPIQGEIEALRIKYCINKENRKEAQTLFKRF